MLAKARITLHPIHPMLVPFPIGLYGFSFLCDLCWYLSAGDGWRVLALYTMAAGTVGALCAAVPGLIDLLAIRRRPLRKLGLWHMSVNLTVVALYLANLWLRINGSTSAWQVLLAGAAVMLLMVSGWLGGELVYVHGVAVLEQSGPADVV